MVPDVRTIVRNSFLYRIIALLINAGKQSWFLQLLDNERVLAAGVSLFLVVSVIRILISGLHVTVKFVSFILLAAILCALVWPYTKPVTDS